MPQTTVLDYKEDKARTVGRDVGTRLRISSYTCRGVLYLDFCLEVDGTLWAYGI
jgi:hypothetical protein